MITLSLTQLGMTGRAELQRMARDDSGNPITLKVPAHPFRDALLRAALAHAAIMSCAAERDVIVIIGNETHSAGGIIC